MEALVDFEAVAAVPVAAFFDEPGQDECEMRSESNKWKRRGGEERGGDSLFGFHEVCGDDVVVAEEESDSCECEDEVNFGAYAWCLL